MSVIWILNERIICIIYEKEGVGLVKVLINRAVSVKFNSGNDSVRLGSLGIYIEEADN